jgi:hypothetical protein
MSRLARHVEDRKQPHNDRSSTEMPAHKTFGSVAGAAACSIMTLFLSLQIPCREELV